MAGSFGRALGEPRNACSCVRASGLIHAAAAKTVSHLAAPPRGLSGAVVLVAFSSAALLAARQRGREYSQSRAK